MKQPSERPFDVIVSLDLVGYSRLTELDEVGTHRALMGCMQKQLLPIIEGHRGEIIKSTGDGALLRFSSASAALDAMIRFQLEVNASEASFPVSRRLVFRIGIHMGPTICDRGDVYGHDVNIAVRLQEVAAPGSIFLSKAILDRLDGKARSVLERIGKTSFKNMTAQTEIFCWRDERCRPRIRSHNVGGMIAAVLLLTMTFPTAALNGLGPVDEPSARHDRPEVERLPTWDRWTVLYPDLAGRPAAPGIRTTMATTERALENRQEIAEDHYLQALALYRHRTPKAFAQAVQHLDDASTLMSDASAVHALQAALYWGGYQNRWQIGQGMTRIGMLNRARAHLTLATSVSPFAHMVRSEMLTASGRHRRAIEEARRAIQLDSHAAIGHYAEGRALLFAGRAVEAETSLRTAVRLDPNASHYLFGLALSQFSQDRFDDAERTLIWATTQNDENDWPHLLLAATRGHLGMSKQALQAVGRFNRLSLQRRGWFASQIPYVHQWPFHHDEDSQRFHLGMVLAGMPDISR